MLYLSCQYYSTNYQFRSVWITLLTIDIIHPYNTRLNPAILCFSDSNEKSIERISNPYDFFQKLSFAYCHCFCRLYFLHVKDLFCVPLVSISLRKPRTYSKKLLTQVFAWNKYGDSWTFFDQDMVFSSWIIYDRAYLWFVFSFLNFRSDEIDFCWIINMFIIKQKSIRENTNVAQMNLSFESDGKRTSENVLWFPVNN